MSNEANDDDPPVFLSHIDLPRRVFQGYSHHDIRTLDVTQQRTLVVRNAAGR